MITKHKNLSLLPYNTFGIDVKADTFIEYSSVDELTSILCDSEEFLSRPFLHIGSGSNLLFLSDFEGVILHSAIKGVDILEETADSVIVRVGAGVIWDDFVAYCVDNDWWGAENLSLIPGEVGASAVQNIGAYGVEVKDILLSVETIEIASLKERTFTNEEIGFSYRKSIFKNELKGEYIVTHVVYKLSKVPVYCLSYGNIQSELEKQDEPISLSLIRKVIIDIRKAKLPDPAIEGNAGSFFMNPVVSADQFSSLQKRYPDIPHYNVGEELVKIPAAWLIDRSGWKGNRLGNAGVHDKQALVLVNKGGATGDDILRLSRAIQKSVYDEFGIHLHPEVNFIGG